jgi:type VI secretion system protein VasD
MSKIVAGVPSALSLVLGFLLLTGCQTVGRTLNLDTDVTLTFKTAENINPDDSQKPSPLFVRFYELKSKSVFEKAEFIDLYERDSEILAKDLVSKKELKRLTPGEIRKETFVLDPDTKYIALFAEFLGYRDSSYQVIVPVETNNVFEDDVKINITSNVMTIVKK